MFNTTDKVRVEKILVAAAGTVIEPTGQALYNTTTGALQLDAGQIGFYNAVTNTSFVGAGAASHPVFYIAQGRDTSEDAPQLPYKPIERSEDIVVANGLRMTAELCTLPTNNTWLLSTINVTDEATYETRIAFNGRRSDIYNGRNTPAIYGSFTAPNYTDEIAAGTYADAAAAKDHLIQNIVADLQSRNNGTTHSPSVIAIALDSADAGGATVTVDDIALGSVGDVITIGWSSGENPRAITLTLTEGIIDAFNIAVYTDSSLLGTEGIVPVVVTEAAATASTLDIAGSGTIAADQILLIAPDVRLAANDKIKQVKERITIGLTSGYTSATTKTELISPDEGRGSGRHWQLFYESTDGLRKFDSTIEGLDGGRIAFPSDIVAGTKYAAYLFYHNSKGMASNGLQSESPYVTIVLVPCCEETLKDAVEAVITGMVSAFPGFASTYGTINVGACPELGS